MHPLMGHCWVSLALGFPALANTRSFFSFASFQSGNSCPPLPKVPAPPMHLRPCPNPPAATCVQSGFIGVKGDFRGLSDPLASLLQEQEGQVPVTQPQCSWIPPRGAPAVVWRGPVILSATQILTQKTCSHLATCRTGWMRSKVRSEPPFPERKGQFCNLWHTGNIKHSVSCVTINPVTKLL